MKSTEFEPRTPAPHSGLFEEINIFGAPTGVTTFREAGEPFPGAPRGFAWRPLAELSISQLRARAARYREMAATATTTEVMSGLSKIAERLDALADQRERGKGEAS